MDVSLGQRLPGDPLLREPSQKSATRLQELSYQSQERLEVSYTDPAGSAYHLTIERSTSAYAATYDRSGGLDRSGQASGRQSQGLAQGIQTLAEGLDRADDAVQGFRRLLHSLLKNADPAYAQRWAGLDDLDSQAGSTQVATASESVTVTLEVTGTPTPDYWSEESTAGRLVDFAVSLFPGGDRSAHNEKMAAAMEQGFREAEKAFGGSLPDIARRTVDLARERLAAWASEPSQPTQAGTGKIDLAA